MRPDGTRNVVITDHLGSTRLTLSTDAAPMQSQLHNAFGEVTSDVGEGARTGYIGREHDVESDLGFYGVRLYEPEYGRFMSTDPLWGKYITLQPYHYCSNQPVSNLDFSGRELDPSKMTEKEKKKYDAAMSLLLQTRGKEYAETMNSVEQKIVVQFKPYDLVGTGQAYSEVEVRPYLNAKWTTKFDPELGKDIPVKHGSYKGGTIYLPKNVSVEALAELLAHEIRHHWEALVDEALFLGRLQY